MNTPATPESADSTPATAPDEHAAAEAALAAAAPPDAPRKPRAPRAKGGSPLVRPARAAAAYNRVLPKVIALPAADVSAPGVDVAQTVAAALTALPKLVALRDEVARELPRHPLECFDALEDLALAAWFAQVREELAGDEAPSLEDLSARAGVLREELLIAGEALARRDLLDAARLRAVRDAGGANVAEDLLALSELFTWGWGNVRNKTAVTAEEVAEAGDLAQRLIVALGRREEASAATRVTDFGARALTLFARAYDECSRAVAYLRWHEGDAAEFAPPLFAKRARAAKKPRAAGEAAGAEAESAAAEAPAEAASPEVNSAGADAGADAGEAAGAKRGRGRKAKEAAPEVAAAAGATESAAG